MNYEKLTDKELISILIRERSQEDISERLIDEFGTLPELFINSEIAELTQIQGVGDTRAHLIKAIYELARRLQQVQISHISKISSPSDAAAILMPDMNHLKFEVMKAIFLNTKNHVLSVETIVNGSPYIPK